MTAKLISLANLTIVCFCQVFGSQLGGAVIGEFGFADEFLEDFWVMKAGFDYLGEVFEFLGVYEWGFASF
jgi:hypothetical protein